MVDWPTEHADACLERLFGCALMGGELDTLARDWIVRSVLAAVREGVPLDAALGLAGGGSRSLRSRWLARQRDAHLCTALEAVAFDATVSDWQRCERLAPLVRRFAADTWPRCRRLQRPPSDWPTWKAELFHAAATGLDLPNSPRGLLRALTRARAYSCQRGIGTLLAHYL